MDERMMSAVVELPAGGPLQRDDGEGSQQPAADHPERVAGAAATEAEQKCTHGVLLGSTPPVAGTTPPSRDPLTCDCAGAELGVLACRKARGPGHPAGENGGR